ncbi:hypothetical protein Pmani_000264 [Petrolisthes manimaculis]|uniref:Sphingomyelin phosphodiesterase n=1 Tax=Petrolisthes manimaculis TaxID=1843537 RepID=A0AAE1QN35_9EUCA|nr:hypothetical protein Pmani_000264 [Petrolisthes manimaculis]
MEMINEEMRDAVDTGIVGSTLKQISKYLDLKNLLRGTSIWETFRGQQPDGGPGSVLFCSTCNVGINQIIHSIQNGTDPEDIVVMMTNLCVDLELGNFIFCDSFLHIAEPQLFWIIENTENLDGKDACGMLFPGFGCNTDNPARVWEVTMPNTTKPPITRPPLPEPGSPTMKVLHLADTHYDPYYKVGSNAVCPEKYHCCREESGPLEVPEAAAGQWGDYRNCDAPRWLLEALYEDINTRHPDIDFIIWTGDIVPHNIWNTSREGNLLIIRDAVQMIQDYFPDTPVFPALGNHESHPVNAFPQPYIDNEFDISWLYDEITTLWEQWLPAEVASTILYSAYYSTLIKPGLRILSINTNYCYSLNWWLIYDDVDPASELEWMAQELQKAEDAGEMVYLISHHPPGHDDCSKTWSHQYNRIILRYEATIAGLFYGHTHKDHFMMVYDENDRPALVGYVAQSQTPYHNLNPGYKIYTIDGDYQGSTYQVLDNDNYIMDLDEANFNNNSSFFLLYSAKEAFGLNNLTPSSWSGLVDIMKEPNSTVFDQFFRYYTKDGRPYREEGCDESCKSNLLCRLVVSDTSNTTRCDQFN